MDRDLRPVEVKKRRPLSEIPLAEAQRVVRRIVHQESGTGKVPVAAFGSFILKIFTLTLDNPHPWGYLSIHMGGLVQVTFGVGHPLRPRGR